MLRGGAMRLGGAVLVVPSPRWCRSAPPLACLLGSGSPGTWLLAAPRTWGEQPSRAGPTNGRLHCGREGGA